MARHATTQSLSMTDYFTTTLTGNVALSDTVINLAAVPSGVTEGYLVIDPNTVASREVIYFNSATSSTVTCPDATQGSSRGLGGTTAQTHTSGTAVEMRNVAEYWLELQNGNAHEGLRQRAKDLAGGNPFVVSGGVWTGDSLGSTLNASMTQLVCYINGRKLTVAAVTARAFTASKDTYVDVLDNQDNTGTLVFTLASNNAASPALASNSIRIAIVVSGASSIAAAGSINQGSPKAVLPIASSTAYSVTDSLGNMIYNTSPNPVRIGYREITAGVTATAPTATTLVTGLTCPVIIPAGRQVKITFQTQNVANSGGTASATAICVSSASDVNRISQSAIPATIGTSGIGTITIATEASVTGSRTYVAGVNAAANNVTVNGASVAPSFISVELV